LGRKNSIKCSGGEPFANDTDRKEYIREHFAKIYRKDPNEPENLRGCIENFLGEGIFNNPVVADSRLSNEEMTTLDLHGGTQQGSGRSHFFFSTRNWWFQYQTN
jgi:hypothetical protein